MAKTCSLLKAILSSETARRNGSALPLIAPSMTALYSAPFLSSSMAAALDEAKETIDSITGLEVTDITAKVDRNSVKITQYRVTVRIAFGVKLS